MPISLGRYLQESIAVLEKCLEDRALKEAVERTYDALLRAIALNKPILLCGNGGSAADAEHFAAELVCRYRVNRRAVNAMALSNSGALATAISNDFGYEEIFARQVEGLGQEEGVFVGITTSGQSPNIMRALQVAKEKCMVTIALIGSYSDSVSSHADIVIAVPSSMTSLVQQAHLVIYHHLCGALEKALQESF